MNHRITTGLGILALFLSIILLAGCGQDNQCHGEPLVFSSLGVEPDTVEAGEYARVTATAEGCRLSYHWSVTSGGILGSGAIVTYAASPCSVGDNTITCTVKDGNDQSQTKKTRIVVR